MWNQSRGNHKLKSLLFSVVGLAVLMLLTISTALAGSTPSTTTLQVSANRSVLGQAVTLTATVSPLAATGKVTFYDGVSILAIGKLSGGQVAMTTALLSSGAHSLKALYSGDDSYQASTAASLSQTVAALGQWGFQTAVSYTVGFGPGSMTVGDFNGDGVSDLAVADAGGDVAVLLGNGDGTFRKAAFYGLFFGLGRNPARPGFLGVGDFNGDGRQDLAVPDNNNNNNNVSLLFGNGDGTFRAAVPHTVGLAPTSVAVGDFNGDGVSDLAVANSGFLVGVLLGNGDATFKPSVRYSVGNSPLCVAVGDFNGDGLADLAVANSDSGNMSVLLGNGDGTFQTAVGYRVVGAGPGPVTVGDFNGDGVSDLAVGSNVYREGSKVVIESNVSVLLGLPTPAAEPTVFDVALPNATRRAH